ncbi:MAG: DUF2179 domain-containing protein [Candidatus Caldatribacteriaceae bacterium]
MEGFDWYGNVILPLIVFASRIGDVSLGTMRIILTARRRRNIAPLLGFLEVLIWIVVVSKLIAHARTPSAFLGYAAGFALGNFVGIYIKEWFAIGYVIVRVILREGERLLEALKEAGFGVTMFDGEGTRGPVKLVFTVVHRRDLSRVTSIIRKTSPYSFFSVEDVRSTHAGVFSQDTQRSKGSPRRD